MTTQIASVTPRLARGFGGVRSFVHTENASAIILLVATLLALGWANSPWSASYHALWETELAIRFGSSELALDLRHWVNDGLMALFFFVAGLEIRREIDMGELRERRRVAGPVLAALGGMALPALIYLAFNFGQPTARGWGIPMGTDTAFALGVLILVGGAAPRVRTFLLSMVVIDDAVALSIIAVAYTDELAIVPLLIAVGLLVAVLGLRVAGVRHGGVYFLVGAGVWLATLTSGVHATIAGVMMGLLATAYPPSRDELSRAGTVWRLFREEPTPRLARTASRTVALTVSPNERLQHLFHPWTSFLVVPFFALANAGVEISGEALRGAATSPIAIGILVGLVAGKLVGITAATWLGWRLWRIPLTVTWPALVGLATVAGIGFTVSLLIADISFEGQELAEAKLGILSASLLAAGLSALAFRLVKRSSARASIGALAAPIIDLSDPVDPDVDHVRGSPGAPLVLVEYGDFECPFCLRAEAVLSSLAEAFGDDLAFVFRHLPLDEVHDHARLASEAAEVAGAQGRFWEMHDTLFAHQDALREDDLITYAAQLGLDVDRFASDLQHRRYALRVERDIASADDSGAAGTPTFFINGRRHRGGHDLGSLTEALRRELQTIAKQRQ
ncbi:MAG TPA: Na+/H+ antiporter NhaA [Acidimicrobiia bacterium]|nr:Na+/H+ antiporter NhaA [Acidimicrobiia bacterium]